jgi:hypothetical protein
MEKKPEGIRAWYANRTRTALRGVILATLISALIAAVGFVAVPRDLVLHAQVFNGAFVIPVFGGIWIAAFVILWLIPMREVSFRGQESMERMEASFMELHERAMVIVKQIENGDHPLMKKLEERATQLEAHMAAIRSRIERDTSPLPVARRPISVVEHGDNSGNGD